MGTVRASGQGGRRGRGGVAVLVLALLVSCAYRSPEEAIDRLGDHDPALRLEREDFRRLADAPEEALAEQRARQLAAAAQQVPDLYPVLAAPPPPPVSPDKRVSVQVTDDVPLKDVLFELARQAEVDIEIDPRIEGGIVFSARDRPFLEVVDRIARLGGLRWRAADNTVTLEIDEPYLVNYNVRYLSQIREAEGQVSVDTRVASPGDSGGQQENDSQLTVRTRASSDLFTEAQNAIAAILLSTQPAGLTTVATAAPVVVNRQAGIISVFGTSRQQEKVADLLEALEQSVSTQVVIDAKIIEVNLADQYDGGINWRAVLGDSQLINAAARFGTVAAFPPFAAFDAATQGLATFAVDGDDLGAIVNFVQTFGTTRTLSAPRLTVMNNQTAVLKSATNFVYFDIEVSTTRSDTGVITDRTVTSEVQTVPIGLVLTVQPSIDATTEEIILTLRPTVTRIVNTVQDPAVAIESDNTVDSAIPIVEVREIDSVLRLQSGEIGVLGGLMQNTATNTDQGVPVVSDIPLIGGLFKSRSEDAAVQELVILIRAEVVRSHAVPPADKRLYQRYNADPRPFSF